MHNHPHRRRQVLRVLVKMLALGGAAALVLALLATLITPQHLKPSQVIYFDPSDLAPGEAARVEWHGRQVIVLRRTPKMLAALEALEPELMDPASRRSRQPQSVDPITRAHNPEWFVVLAHGTAFGCPVEFVAPDAAHPPRELWPGGFVEQCGSIPYDPAGRVFRHRDAIRNLDIPPHELRPDGRIAIGNGN